MFPSFFPTALIACRLGANRRSGLSSFPRRSRGAAYPVQAVSFSSLTRGKHFSFTADGQRVHKKASRATYDWNGNKEINKPIKPDTLIYT